MPDLSLESGILNSGVQFVAGVDEAGRGPLAGPVVAAAVILPPDLTGDELWLQSLDDSKKLTQIAFLFLADHTVPTNRSLSCMILMLI